MSISTIVSGATGACGREFVIAAVKDQNIGRIVALSRKDIAAEEFEKKFPGIDQELAKKKLSVVAMDWEALHKSGGQDLPPSLIPAFQGHQLAVMAMGTTKKDAGSAAAFRHCDYDFVVAFAKAVKKFTGETLRHYAQISASGADKTSWFNYMKTKGEADDYVINQAGFPSVSVYRPGLLGRKDKSRTWEALACKIAPSMPVEDVGQSILSVSLDVLSGISSTSSPPSGTREDDASPQDEAQQQKKVDPIPTISLWYNAGMKKRAAEWQSARLRSSM